MKAFFNKVMKFLEAMGSVRNAMVVWNHTRNIDKTRKAILQN